MLFKDENLSEDMVDILRNLHVWVPHANENGEKSLNGFLLWEIKKQWSVDWRANSQSAMHTQNRDAWKGYSSS